MRKWSLMSTEIHFQGSLAMDCRAFAEEKFGTNFIFIVQNRGSNNGQQHSSKFSPTKGM